MNPVLQVVRREEESVATPALGGRFAGYRLLLDRCAAAFRAGGAVGEIFHAINAAAGVLRHQLDAEDWQAVCAMTQAHEVMLFVRQDPMIDRCIRRPRGYAGDAVMIDMLYHHPDISPQLVAATPLGRQVHMSTVHAASARAVRDRRQLLADMIDTTAATTEKPHVLAVAAGHLREAEISGAFASGALGRMVALDQDAESCGVVRARHGDRVEIIPESITALLKGGLAGERFHLVYAAGLYDYLDARIGNRLVQRMAALLAPGGRLLVANFADTLFDAGGMEAVMDWHLIYRNAADMAALADGLGEGFGIRTFSGSQGDVVYLDVTRLA